MKTQKLFSLDYELALKLSKEPNASALVNQLIKEYYARFEEDSKLKSMNKEELKQFIAIEDIREEAIAKMKEIDPNATI